MTFLEVANGVSMFLGLVGFCSLIGLTAYWFPKDQYRE